MPTITFEGTPYALGEEENLLAGLERLGAAVPSSCRSGVCQSCLLKATAGDIPPSANKGLRDTQRAQGYLLACCCTPTGDMTLERPGDAGRVFNSRILELRRLNDRTLEVVIERPEGFAYNAGQFLNLHRPGNIVRSYSLASVPELDAHLHLHIALMPGGAMSTWIAEEAAQGHEIALSGPVGNCFYVPGNPAQPLLLFGTGTGLAPLYGILRDALAQGHTGPIDLFHGSPVDEGLYLHDALYQVTTTSPQVNYRPCVLGPAQRAGVTQGDMVAITLSRCADLTGFRVYLCGNPDIVRTMQKKCFLAGANMRDIFADAFLPAAK